MKNRLPTGDHRVIEAREPDPAQERAQAGQQQRPRLLQSRAMAGSKAERRCVDRCRLSEKVQWSTGDSRYVSTVLDISEGGIRMACGECAVQLFQRIKLFIPLPSEDHLSKEMFYVEGVVVWKNACELGVSFLSPDKETVQKLRAYIQLARAIYDDA